MPSVAKLSCTIVIPPDTKAVANELNPEASANFYKLLIGYFQALPEEKRYDLLYDNIKKEQNELVASRLSEIIKELNLFDFEKCMEVLRTDDFKIQKRALRLITCDKPFYCKEDLQNLDSIRKFISATFTERGKRTKKKQLLSSKEKEVWTCECGKTNEIDAYCSKCDRDIFGFKAKELKPVAVKKYLEQKIELISELIDNSGAVLV